MISNLLLCAAVTVGVQGDPTRTTVPEAADGAAASAEHPVVAAVRTSLEANGGRTDRAFMLVVSIQTSDAEKLLQAFESPLAETVKEDGNLLYTLNRDTDEPEKFLLVERWKSLDALASHLEQPYLVKLLADLEELATIELRVLRKVGPRRGKRAKKAASN